MRHSPFHFKRFLQNVIQNDQYVPSYGDYLFFLEKYHKQFLETFHFSLGTFHLEQSVNIIFPSRFFASKKFKTRTFQLSVNIFHAKINIILSFFCFFHRAEAPSFSFLKMYYGKIIFLPTSSIGKYFFFATRNP